MSSAAQICFCSRSKATQKPSGQSKNSCPEPLACLATGFGSQTHSGTGEHQLCAGTPLLASPPCSVCAGSLAWPCLCAGTQRDPLCQQSLLLPGQGASRVQSPTAEQVATALALMARGTQSPHRASWLTSVSSMGTAWAQLLSACLRALSFLVAIAFYMEKASRFLPVMKGPHSSGSCCGQCLFCFVEIIYMGTFPIILELQDLVRG